MSAFRPRSLAAAALVAVLLLSCNARGQRVRSAERHTDNSTVYTLANDRVALDVTVQTGKLMQERLAVQPAWAKEFGLLPSVLETDGDWSMNVMWTDWQAPLKQNNAENPVELSKRDFSVKSQSFDELEDGTTELSFDCASAYASLAVRIVYRLEPGAFYLRKKLIVSDSNRAGHFLQSIAPVDGIVLGRNKIVKDGGFGQPVALQTLDGGAFLGLEYPAADNTITQTAGKYRVVCLQERGEIIGHPGLQSDWAVLGVTPNFNVKWWFMRYVDAIRVAPLKPFVLYNSWYDLRSVDYPNVPPQNAMTEQNVLRIVDLLKRNMVQKHGIALDAFVLDDGWDEYESGWALRRSAFPRGLEPISAALASMGTSLGMWLGPTGGYSFRMKRIGWMKEHGYETVGGAGNNPMLCVAGTKYAGLLTQRVTDLIATAGVGYFKWDGLQFSCSEPSHGHLPGIYSRRAVMEAVAGLAGAARAKKPDVFLNISSGTWMSPWWLRYANQVWMQGEDYGYADVPSISPRDASITYRDLVLYDDFRKNNFWFPMANLMTHGVIKGTLELLGGAEEPIEKFTNEVLLYLARGVSMWELYISPDILSDAEWDVLGRSLRWARDRFPILANTEMVGGDPKKREPYGYVHFRGRRGILAARNPWIDVSSLRVQLLPAYGIDADASDLVIEKVYPERWISPRLYKANEMIQLPLTGYETALYEVYPISEARRPLLAGVTFERAASDERRYAMTVYGITKDALLLNPAWSSSVLVNGEEHTIDELAERIPVLPEPLPRKSAGVDFDSAKGLLTVHCVLDKSVESAELAVLLEPATAQEKRAPDVVQVKGGGDVPLKNTAGEQKSRWFTTPLPKGEFTGGFALRLPAGMETWRGQVTFYAVCRQGERTLDVSIVPPRAVEEPPMPPRAFPAGTIERVIKLGDAAVSFARPR